MGEEGVGVGHVAQMLVILFNMKLVVNFASPPFVS